MNLERFLNAYADTLSFWGFDAIADWYRSMAQELAVEWERTGEFPLPT